MSITIREENYRFGKIKGIDGSNINLKAEKLEIGEVGNKRFVEVGGFVNCGGHHGDTICVVSRVLIDEVERREGIEEQKIVELVVVGSVDSTGKFSRGVDRLPTIGCNAYILDGHQVNTVLGFGDGDVENKYFPVGNRGYDEDEMFLNLDKLFGRHVSILGTTGSGKSCTVASLTQSVLRCYEHPRIVFFDIHNEYNSAFEGEWEEKKKYTSWDEFSLPYWFLDLPEFINIYHPDAGSTQKAEIKKIITTLKRENAPAGKIQERISVESPIFFDINKLLEIIDAKASEGNATAKKPWISMKLKFESIMGDSRYDFLHRDIDKKVSLEEYFDKLLGISENKYLQILDLSGLPSEVRTVCVGVLARLFFDYSYWDFDPENLPIALVLEEAHTYIPEDNSSVYSLCKDRIERIAKEGRKYGLSLVVVSQRPSNVSTTVLSQCGTFITLRLTNDVDQNKIRRLLPDALGNQASLLPSLRDGEALVTGDASVLPGRIKFNEPNPYPRSNDVRYHKSWHEGIPTEYDLNKIIYTWKVRERGAENED